MHTITGYYCDASAVGYPIRCLVNHTVSACSRPQNSSQDNSNLLLFCPLFDTVPFKRPIRRSTVTEMTLVGFALVTVLVGVQDLFIVKHVKARTMPPYIFRDT
jgi:hypothetical protein